MTITLDTDDRLRAAVGALREWQHDDAPPQLHPGDIGWFWRHGADATAAAVRTWSRDGRILAVGLLDGPDLLRLTVAPDARRDEQLAHRVAGDVSDPGRGVLPAGRVAVEAWPFPLLRDVLSSRGWADDEPWSPLVRDLAEPVPEPGVRIVVAGPAQAAAWASVLRAAFHGSTFGEQRWQAMATGLPFEDARCLLAYAADSADDADSPDADEAADSPVAVATVWSAGVGVPGLLEPMGVHREHRGRGYGTAITLAAAAALRALGSSRAVVATPSSNTGGVATYRAAGFVTLPEVRDVFRA